MDKTYLKCDLLVIGAGLAGMVAASRASDAGLTTIQAGSSSGFFLASGLIDFLGVYPVNPPTLLERPIEGLQQLKEDMSDHPYARVSSDYILKTFDYLQGVLTSTGLEYQIGENNNFQILTAAGTFKPTFMIPKTMSNGPSAIPKKKRVLLVDFDGLKGFSANQIAPQLKLYGHQVETLSIDVPEFAGDFNVTRLARQFEEENFLNRLAGKIIHLAKVIDFVGFPAVCGINNSLDIIKKIEELTGVVCFEIPGLPPSIPGLRLKNAFEKKISRNCVTVLNNSVVTFHAFENTHIVLDAVFQNINTRIKAKGVILASGRFPGGGLRAKRGLIQETVFNVPVHQPATRNLWYDVDFFHPDGHGINQAGIQTDHVFRPIGENGESICDRLYAAGSILAHNDWVRLKSGAGVSCISACAAVDHFYASAGGDNA